MEQLKDIAPAGQHILISLADIDAIKMTDTFQITEVKGKDQGSSRNCPQSLDWACYLVDPFPNPNSPFFGPEVPNTPPGL
ncbi:hypothetical protein MJO29_000713 [Puccinia striiformis f. sp. tritici]|nr:hypothetical protein MJO29_000713 [Puccinia striiformis f. sp. tritici]